MQKRIIILCFTLLFIFSLTGCSDYIYTTLNEYSVSNGDSGATVAYPFMEKIGHLGNGFTEYRDYETGVHYIVYEKTNETETDVAISPRYNADGSLYVN